MKLDWNVITPILAVLSPILLALLGGVGWLYKHEKERRESAEQQLSENKRNAYIALLSIFFDIMKSTKTGRSTNEKESLIKMMDANKELILYGSDEVVRIFQKWLDETRRGITSLNVFGELIVAIRRDMGHKKTTLKPEEILRQLINDYDDAKAKGVI